jgi:hypothetical protein
VNDLNLYVLQLLLVAAGVSALVWRTNIVCRLQVCGWILLNYVIALRYGLIGQLEFYSNDQLHFVNVVETLLAGTVSADVDWWISSARVPFTIPAFILASAGIDVALALKTTSLLFLLGTTHLIVRHARIQSLSGFALLSFMTGLAFSGSFFSSLAQRETSMMFFAVLLFVGKSPAVRGASLLMLLLLRPHLAVAIAIGWICAVLSQRDFRKRSWSPGRAVTAIASGAVIGYVLFGVGFQYQTGISGIFGHQFGIRPVLRIASNFMGLQFLTAYDTTIELSVSQLLLGRLIFAETILIPVAFTLHVLTSRGTSQLTRWTLWSFAIYVGLVTNTDFNSFRQNIPLIPVMGLCVMEVLKHKTDSRRSTAEFRTLAET